MAGGAPSSVQSITESFGDFSSLFNFQTEIQPDSISLASVETDATIQALNDSATFSGV